MNISIIIIDIRCWNVIDTWKLAFVAIFTKLMKNSYFSMLQARFHLTTWINVIQLINHIFFHFLLISRKVILLVSGDSWQRKWRTRKRQLTFFFHNHHAVIHIHSVHFTGSDTSSFNWNNYDLFFWVPSNGQ